jgi:hypothetical protein
MVVAMLVSYLGLHLAPLVAISSAVGGAPVGWVIGNVLPVTSQACLVGTFIQEGADLYGLAEALHSFRAHYVGFCVALCT